MAEIERPGPWQWQQAIASSDGRPTQDFLRWLNGVLRNAGILDEAKQEKDGDLDALAGLAGTGIAVRRGVDSWATRTLEAGPGIEIANPDGVDGNPVISATGSDGAGILPVVDGSVPPVFIQNPDGSLVYARIN